MKISDYCRCNNNQLEKLGGSHIFYNEDTTVTYIKYIIMFVILIELDICYEKNLSIPKTDLIVFQM